MVSLNLLARQRRCYCCCDRGCFCVAIAVVVRSGGDGGGSQKRVFLGCKKHSFSGSEEELKKPPADHKEKIFLRGDQKRIQKSGQRTSKRRCGGGMGEGPRSVFF